MQIHKGFIHQLIIWISIIGWLATMVYTDIYNKYYSIVLLPIIFIFCCLLFNSVPRAVFSSMVSLILVGGYFIRMVVLPVLFCIGGYQSGFLFNKATSNDVVKAVILLCLENIVVFGVASNEINNSRGIEVSYIDLFKVSYRKLDFILLACVIVMIVCYFLVPQLQTVFVFITKVDFKTLATLRWDNETIVARGSSSRYFYSLFVFLWDMLKMPLMARLIYKIYKRFGDSRKGAWFSMIALVIPSCLLSGDNVTPLMGFLLGMFLIKKVYVLNYKGPLTVVIITFFIVFIAVFSAKVVLFRYYGGSNVLATLSQTINAYFNGFDSIAIGYASVHGVNRLSTLFTDIGYSVPFNSTILNITGERFTKVYGTAIADTGSIPPFSYQLSFYFGIPIAILLVGFMIKIIYRSEKKYKRTTDFWLAFLHLYFCFYSVLSLSCYSFSAYLTFLIGTWIPLLFLAHLGSRYKRR